ncbi:hypothetical protein V2154_04015 [Ewingella sp. CoE-038-23]|uniref:hypothetical protein n=1 Tax=Ewingella docleensis TaxID=3118588 RepID=UPI0033659CA8
MLNKDYIWKDITLSARRLPIIIVTVLVIFILLSISGAYFLLYVPKKERLAQEQIAQQQIEQKVQQVKQYYLDSFTGGHISSLNRLLTEIARSRVPLEMAGYREENITCDTTRCDFQYLLKDHAIFSLQLKKFWHHYFMASFAASEINYQGVPSKLENHPLLQKYQSGDAITLPQCVNLLSYIHSHNTTVAKPPYRAGVFSCGPRARDRRAPCSEVQHIKCHMGDRTAEGVYLCDAIFHHARLSGCLLY